MTVAVTVPEKVSSPGNGSATVFSFDPIVIFEASDMTMVEVDDATGAETPVPQGTGPSAYAVVVSVYPGTGSIRYPEDAVTPIASGKTVVMKPVYPLKQGTNLENQGGYFADTQETIVDKLLLIDKQQQEVLGRTVQLPIGFTGTVGETDTPVAGRYLSRNSTNDGFSWSAVSSSDADASNVTPTEVAATGQTAGVAADFAREDHKHNLADDGVTYAKVQDISTTQRLLGRNSSGAGIIEELSLSTTLDWIGAGVTRGDLLQRGASAWGRTAIGATRKVLQSDGTDAAWSDNTLPAMMRGHIAGLTLSNDAGDTAHDINVLPGVATADDQSEIMVLASEITKKADATWAVGDDAGGMAAGESMASNATIHVWLIRRSDTGVVDVMFNNNTTSGLSPTLPTNYDQKRRIGSLVLDGSANFLIFVHVADEFLLSSPVQDFSETNPGTSAVLRALSVPVGINVRAHVRIGLFDDSTVADTYALATSPGHADVGAGSTLHSLFLRNNTAGEDQVASTHAILLTNTAAQIRTRLSNSDAGIAISGTTFGWFDTRGRDD